MTGQMTGQAKKGRRNLATRLKCRNRGQVMARYDRLPPGLRLWLADAALPWSPHSALKLWQRLHRECDGDEEAIRRRFDLAEARLLARDVVLAAGRRR